MARKKVVVSQQKKRRHGCCTCALIVFIVFVVILGTGVGVGWYFGDKYTRQYLDMSLSDCFGVINDLTHANEKKIVQKKYSSESEAEFETALRKHLFLNDNTDLNKDTLMQELVGSTKNSYGGVSTAEALLSDGEDEQVDAETEGEGSSNALINYVASLFSKSNLNMNALSNYSEEHHDEYILAFKDVQLAAFLSSVIKVGLGVVESNSSGALSAISEVLGDKTLSDVVFLDQIVFYGSESEPHTKLTVSMDVRTVANGYISKASGMNLNFLIKLILPKRVFLTVDVAMCDGGELRLYVNQMNDKKMDRLFKFINGLMSMGGGQSTDIKQTISDSTEKIVGGMANAIANYGSMSQIGSGTLKIDLLQALIGVSHINDNKEDWQALKSSDIIYLLKYIITSDFEVERVDYAQYEDALLGELQDKYLIKTEGQSFSELMKLFGIGDAGSGKTLVDWIDADKMGTLASRDDNINVVITDEMLGAIFNAEINSVISGSGTIANMNPHVTNMHIEKADNGKIFMHAGITVKPASILGESSIIGKMVSGLFGEDMLFSFIMEITPNKDAQYSYAETTMLLNDLDVDDMNRLMSILSKFGIDFSMNGIISQIETPMRDALSSMEAQMPGLTFGDSKIELPNLFDVTVKKVLVDDETGEVIEYENENGNKEKLTGNDLKGVIDSLYNYEDKMPTPNIDSASDGSDINPDNIDAEQLGRFVRYKMQQGDDFEGFTELIYANRVDNIIEFIVQVKTSDLFGDDDGADFGKFISVECVYVNITIDLSTKDTTSGGKPCYKTTATINGMESVRRKQFDAIIEKFNENDADGVQYDERANDIGAIVYEILPPFQG